MGQNYTASTYISFILTPSQISLSIHSMLGTVVSTKNTVINKTVKVLTSQNLCSGDERQTINMQREKYFR